MNHTGIAMRNISHVVYYVKTDPSRWYKVNWIIVSTSHAIYKPRTKRGHLIRQKIRRRLWRLAQEKHPILKRYCIPGNIKGDSLCEIKWYYKVFDFFSNFLKQQ
jgi:hypothetical protein